MNTFDDDQPAATPVDPFDARPILTFSRTPAELTTWGLLASLAIMVDCALVAALMAAVVGHHWAVAGVFGAAAAFATVISVHTIRNPPSGMAVNLTTRQYHMVRGSGRLRQSIRGSLDDIRGVACFADESSHGVSGYRVLVLFKAPGHRCVVETHGPGSGDKARERAAKLAAVLGAPLVEK
ncbi:MAG: hypothetical protein P4L33_15580 [Capsulimonadaceae bacterium]|nr:hypothetical protein [Capsulimonadaceae bacterium]